MMCATIPFAPSSMDVPCAATRSIIGQVTSALRYLWFLPAFKIILTCVASDHDTLTPPFRKHQNLVADVLYELKQHCHQKKHTATI